MFSQKPAHVLYDRLHLGGRGVVLQAEAGMEPELIACGEIFELQIRHLPIGEADQGPVASPDPRGTQANVYYDAERVANLQSVSDAYHPVENDGDSTQDIFQSLLSGQRDRNSAHPESRQRGGGVEAEVVEAEHEADENDQHIEYSAAEANHRSGTHVAGAHQAQPNVVLHTVVEKNKQPHARRDGKNTGGAVPELARHQRQADAGEYPINTEGHQQKTNRYGHDFTVGEIRSLPHAAEQRTNQRT